jgi:hypothetical protein
MKRLGALLLGWWIFSPSPVQADAFDHYTNEILVKIPEATGVKKIAQLTQDQLVEHSRALPGITAAFVVVRTGEGRMCKMLLLPARQKVSSDESVPILLIERFVTFREGEERTIEAQGHNIRLFADFRFNLDLGQVVPASVPADIRLVAKDGQVAVEPVGKAELFLVTRHLPDANPKGTAKPTPGAPFTPQFFNGVFKLNEDGRRLGTLHLKVSDGGEVLGHFYSAKDGQKYEVGGKIGNPNHSIQFRITYPRSIQHFQGWIFTHDGQAITGSANLQDRETGFYALRQEK